MIFNILINLIWFQSHIFLNLERHIVVSQRNNCNQYIT